MKLNKYLLVSIFVLATLMLTAVSASDNIVQEDNVLESDISLADVSDVLSDSYYDDDFYITVQEDYSWDKKDWNSRDLIYISSYSQKNGNFSFLVDDDEKLNVPLTDGYFSIEDDGMGGKYNKTYEYIYPGNLSLDTGNYNIKVKFEGTTLIDSQVTLKEKDDFDIYMLNPYYCDDEYYFDYPSFIIIDSNHNNTGTLEIFVNGTRKTYFNVTNGAFDEIPDCSNKSRYLAPRDILDDYGTYDIKITFTDNSTTETLRDEIVQVIGPEPSEPKLEMYFYFDVQYLRADNVAYIYLPREATGNLTIKYNNHVFDVPYSDGYAEHKIYAWNVQYLGETLVTAIYEGDDFGTLTTNGTIIVTPSVNVPYYASLGEEFTISMVTHEWVRGGKFDVYDYTGDVKGDLISSGVINGGVSSVTVSSDTLGLNKFYLEYDTLGSGKYYSIQQVNIIKNSENIEVDVPKEVPVGNEFNITVTAPPREFSSVSISVDGNDPEFYSIDSGKLVKNISGLSRGYHRIVVQYNYGYYEDGEWVEDIYSNTFYVNAYAFIRYEPEELVKLYNGYEPFLVRLYDENDNPIRYFDIKIKVNNQTFIETTDYVGQASLQTYFDAGVYQVNITDDHSYAMSKITINKITSKTTLSYFKSGEDNVTLTAGAGPYTCGGEMIFSINDKNYTVMVNDSKAVLTLNDLPNGDYSVTAYYNGDVNHNSSVSNTVRFNVKKDHFMLHVPDVTKNYGDYETLTVTLTNNGNTVYGAVIDVCLDDVNYSSTTDWYGKVYIPLDLDCGVYDAVATYGKISNASKITINKIASKTTLSYAKSGEGNVTLTAEVDPYTCGGEMVFSINDKNYTFMVNDSKVVLTWNDMPNGDYSVTAYYNGDVNHNSSVSNTVQFNVKKDSYAIYVPDVTKDYGGSETLIITLTDNGDPVYGALIDVCLDDVNYSRVSDWNGKVYIPLDLDSGVYDAVATYGNISNASRITVNKLATKTDLSFDKFAIDSVALTANVTPSSAGGELVFDVNGEELKSRVSGHSVVWVLTDLDNGEYTVTAFYNGDVNHNSSVSNTVRFNVKKDYYVLHVPDVTKDYGGSETLIITLTNNGDPVYGAVIEVRIGDVYISRVSDNRGKVYIPLDLDSGVYDAVAAYGNISNASKITVNKLATRTDLSFEKLANGRVALTANVIPSSATGELVFNVNGEEFKAEVSGHSVVWVLTDLDAGDYTVTAVYMGDLNHIKSTSNTIRFNVEEKYDVSAPDLTKYYKGPERFVVTVKDRDNNAVVGKNVAITLNGATYNRVTDSKGQASMAINLNSGVYNVTSEFEAIKVKSTITVKSTISGNNVTKIYRNATQYYATFVDTKGNLLKNTDVKFNINGVFYTRTTNDQGVARMNINLNPGTYIITATNPNSTEQHTNVITVLPSIVENYDLTKYYKNASQYTFRLLDSQGKPVGAGVSAKININGVFYTRTTNASGYVKLNINLSPDTYIATVEYNGLMMSNTVKVLPILKAKDISMKYRDGTKFQATLLDGQGKPYAGQKITFNIHGVFYDRTTDNAGVARLNINLMSGEYIITSMYENGATISNKITIRS